MFSFDTKSIGSAGATIRGQQKKEGGDDDYLQGATRQLQRAFQTLLDDSYTVM